MGVTKPKTVPKPGMKLMRTAVLILPFLLSAARVSGQAPKTGYAPVNGLKMYYEIHGQGEPLVLLHGAFMTITNNWANWIPPLAKTRQVIAVEMRSEERRVGKECRSRWS